MKESISITTIFQIVVLFILLFTAIMCLTINNSNAFGVKDEIINMIEASEGNFLDGENLNDDIVNLIKETSYRTTGTCDTESGYVGYARTGERISNGKNAAICIKTVNVTDGLDDYLKEYLPSEELANDNNLHGIYYQVMVFYQLDLPIINQAYNLKTQGETKIIYKIVR